MESVELEGKIRNLKQRYEVLETEKENLKKLVRAISQEMYDVHRSIHRYTNVLGRDEDAKEYEEELRTGILNIEQYDFSLLLTAKTRWESRRQYKGFKLKFEDVFNLLTDNAVNFSMIADKAGVSREYVRQLYGTYFSAFFPGLDGGHDRTKARTQERLNTKFRSSYWLNEIRPILESENIVVEKIKNYDPRHILLNSHYCIFHKGTQARLYSVGHKRKKTPIQIAVESLTRAQFLIAIQDAPDKEKRIYIIPTEVILKAYLPRQRTARYINLYLPFELGLPTYNKRSSRVDWAQYINAWHLLKERTE